MLGLITVVFLFAFSLDASASYTFNKEQSEVLSRYLSSHENYRVATSDDCNCNEVIQNMRKGSGGVWKPITDYFPYRAVGDFNSDGHEDFAVILIDRSKNEKPFVLLVFNGPIAEGDTKPALEESQLELSHQGLFFGPPRPAPYRLLLGPFESDAGQLLMPTGKTYIWD